nr:hemerythrin domain-containing protein [uncultured Bdellovibrio sp.]
MDIYQALKKDHVVVRGLLNDLVNLPEGDKEGKFQLINKIRDELIPHARAEESVFYNSLRSLNLTKDIAMEGYKEHMEAETLLRMLQLQDKTKMDWKNTAQKLRQALEHHIAEEEGRMFEAAMNNFTEEEAQMFGEAFERLKPQIKEQTIVGTTLDMVANLMPPRFSELFRNGPNP